MTDKEWLEALVANASNVAAAHRGHEAELAEAERRLAYFEKTETLVG